MESLPLFRLLAVYVVLLSLDQVVSSGAVRVVANTFAAALPFILIVYYALNSRPLLVPTGAASAYGLLLAGLLGSWVASGMYNFADLVKFALAPIFLVLGYNASTFERGDARAMGALRRYGLFMLLTPLALILVQIKIPPADINQVAFFANRNNAALYMVVLANVLLMMGVRVPWVVAFLAVVSLGFNTLGVLVAVVASLLISLEFRKYVWAYLLAILLALLITFGPFGLPILDRIRPVVDGVTAISSAGLWADLDRMSYLDLYRITGNNSDLSLFFRLKHWEDLLVAWQGGGWGATIFGMGVGSSVLHTDLGLVPHNDYLRFLIETGPLGFLGFAGLVGWILVKTGRRSVLLGSAAVAIYFLSENLVDNFSAMAMFYYFGGYWAQRAHDLAASPSGLTTDAKDEPAWPLDGLADRIG